MSITPTKYVPVQFSLIGVAALLVSELRTDETVSSLWERVKDNPKVRTFDRFADGLTLLFAVGSITLDGGVLVQRVRLRP